jgi:hypothetical protein
MSRGEQKEEVLNPGVGKLIFQCVRQSTRLFGIARIKLIEDVQKEIAATLAAEDARGREELSEISFGGVTGTDFQSELVTDNQAVDMGFETVIEFTDFFPGDFRIYEKSTALFEEKGGFFEVFLVEFDKKVPARGHHAKLTAPRPVREVLRPES